jgi:peptidyl-prolyl cis-trans isomerase SurA
MVSDFQFAIVHNRGSIYQRSRFTRRAIVLALFIHFSGMMPDASAELVDRVAAAVNNDVITLSELRQVLTFNAALGGKADGRRVEAETLQGIINRRLLLQEAYRLKVAEVSEQDIAAEVGRLRQRLGTEASYREFLARTDLTEAQLMKLLGERLLVERFVEKKISLFARVNREDVQAYFNEHPGEFKGKRLAEVQKQIMAVLSEQKEGQQLDQYVEELRSRAFIRINDIREEGK